MKEKIMSCAKGHWQREIADYMVRHGEIENPISSLRGKAKIYSLRYEESLQNLFSRMRETGAKIGYVPGPRGGATLARYTLSL